MTEHSVGTAAPNGQEEDGNVDDRQPAQADVGQPQIGSDAPVDGAPVERGEQLMRLLPVLADKASIREQPFVSDKPIYGRFIVFVREMWNSVAAKWYVRPMLRQQNLYNQAVAEMISRMLEEQIHLTRELDGWQKEIDRRLEEIDQRLISGDQDVTLLARKVAEGEHRLRQWKRHTTEEWAQLAPQLSEMALMMAERFESSVSEADGEGE